MLNGCAQEGTSGDPELPVGDTAATAPTETAPNSNAFRYLWKLQAGYSWKVKSQENRTIVYYPGTAKEEQEKYTISLNRKMNLRNIDKEFAMNLGVFVQDVVVDHTGKGGDWKFNSAAPDSKPDPDGFSALVGKEFSVRMDGGPGQILDVKGAEAIYKDRGKPELVELGNALMREQLNDEFYIYPDGPTEVGATWERTGRLRDPYGLEATHKFELEKRMNDQGFLQRTTEYTPGTPIAALHPEGHQYQLSGTATASFNVEDATGLVYSRVQNTRLSGTLQTDGKEIPVQVEVALISEMSLK